MGEILSTTQLIIRNFIMTVAQVLELAIIVRCIMSWFQPNPYHPLVRKIYELTDPLLRPFQGIFHFGGLDLSPVLALLAIGFVQSLLLRFV
ncbi:protein YggT family [Candidatus Termititenax persephonae]|uniref:Protein YggT family n=2 Tax=Candidatus Termititenax persephonae TaxID=2218525 RepID=A0A388TGL4_9BACT|nr:protein YggT family [Candidatus Termititenax persephonae]